MIKIKKTVSFFLILIFITVTALSQNDNPDWPLVTKHASWKPRDSQGEVVFKDKLWILGGWFNSYEASPRDVWNSANGKDWKLVKEHAPWIHSNLA